VGAIHVRVIAVEVVLAKSFKSELGGLGFVISTAPFPRGDAAELPNTFIASTLAQILDPHARL
jgi:hypothetical protein